jgi:hypothetical protein
MNNLTFYLLNNYSIDKVRNGHIPYNVIIAYNDFIRLFDRSCKKGELIYILVIIGGKLNAKRL